MPYGNYSEYRISKIVKYLNKKLVLTRQYHLYTKRAQVINKWRDYMVGTIRLKVKIDGVAGYEIINMKDSPSRHSFSSQDKVIEYLKHWV